MKKLIAVLGLVLFASVANAEELVKFDDNASTKVYLIKKSLVQENQTVRTIWIKYEYTKFGSDNLKDEMKLVRKPSFSKVKYGFDCQNSQHKVFYAAIYDSKGSVIKTLANGAVEDVIPGSVGEAIRNFTCNYDTENDRSVTDKKYY